MTKEKLEEAYTHNSSFRLARSYSGYYIKECIKVMIDNKEEFFDYLKSFKINEASFYKTLVKNYDKFIYNINYKYCYMFFRNNMYVFKIREKTIARKKSTFNRLSGVQIFTQIEENRKILNSGSINNLNYSNALVEFLVFSFLYEKHPEIKNLTTADYSINKRVVLLTFYKMNTSDYTFDKQLEVVRLFSRYLRWHAAATGLKVSFKNRILGNSNHLSIEYISCESSEELRLTPMLNKVYVKLLNLSHICNLSSTSIELTRDPGHRSTLYYDIMEKMVDDYIINGGTSYLSSFKDMLNSMISVIFIKMCILKSQLYLKNYDKIIDLIKDYFELHNLDYIPRNGATAIISSDFEALFFILFMQKENMLKNIRKIFIDEQIFINRISSLTESSNATFIRAFLKENFVINSTAYKLLF